MPQTLPTTDAPALRISCETPRLRMAKAALTFRAEKAAYGAVLRRASEIAGLNRDQTAAALKVNDPAQISRWWSGTENPQTWRYHAHDKLSRALLTAHAESTDGVRVKVSIKVAR